jgi:predicted DNA-binding protein
VIIIAKMKTSNPQRQTYSVRLKPEVMDQLRHLSIDEHESLSTLLERAIEDILEKYGRVSGEDAQAEAELTRRPRKRTRKDGRD